MSFSDMTIKDFNSVLASREATPGGGGASALAGALGCALAGMVAELTSGKKKYAEHQAEIEHILAEAEKLRLGLERQMDADAEAFGPLAEAYSIPKDAPGRQETLEKCLRAAAEPPMEMLKLCYRAIVLHGRLEQIGSALAISDVGTGVALCRAAAEGAAMNVLANTKLMKDREYAGKLNEDVRGYVNQCRDRAAECYEKVWGRLI